MTPDAAAAWRAEAEAIARALQAASSLGSLVLQPGVMVRIAELLHEVEPPAGKGRAA